MNVLGLSLVNVAGRSQYRSADAEGIHPPTKLHPSHCLWHEQTLTGAVCALDAGAIRVLAPGAESSQPGRTSPTNLPASFNCVADSDSTTALHLTEHRFASQGLPICARIALRLGCLLPACKRDTAKSLAEHHTCARWARSLPPYRSEVVIVRTFELAPE